MDEIYYHNAAWYRAATLRERVGLFHKQPLEFGRIDDAELAQARFERWQSQSPFSNGFLEQRLRTDHLSKEAFLYLLGESAETIHARFPSPPNWLKNIQTAYNQSIGQLRPLAETENPVAGMQMAGFLAFIEPLMEHGRTQLTVGAQALCDRYSQAPFTAEKAMNLLFANLPTELLMMISRTLVLELNVARLQGVLEGETPQERFQSFVQRLEKPAVTFALFQEYPVLARHIIGTIDRWLTASLAFLSHLCHDWNDIRATFCPNDDPGPLKQVVTGAGDKHRGGRSVMILHFASGFKLVYKPRSLDVDTHFQELLQWLNERGDHPPLRTVKILNGVDYGWMEFVTAESCTTEAAIRRFYIRQGCYLALLYALEATDFHYENLIAAGEHPILIDLESLFHPYMESTAEETSTQWTGNIMAHSVLRIGLLPQLVWVNRESEGIDLSGLGANDGQISPEAIPNWDDVGTDEMHMVRRRVAMPGGQNRPTLNGVNVTVEDYYDQLVTGFKQVYRLLLQHRHTLLGPDGILTHFAHDAVRVILRPTRIYGKLLFESYHPDVLRDALDRDRLFDRLWVTVEHNPALAGVIPAEREDLEQGDIPMFTSFPSSTDLWSSQGERLADYFDKSGLDLVSTRLGQLSEADMEKQIWFIQASLATLAPDATHRTAAVLSYAPKPVQKATPAAFLAAACAVGDRLVHQAVHEGDAATWIGLSLVNSRRWSLLPLGVDLYGGLPGNILFLAYLGAISKHEQYTELARKALTTLQRQIAVSEPNIKQIGGFNGWGGIIYLLTHLGVLWSDERLLTRAEELVAQISMHVAQDEMLDIIGGAAGGIAALLALYRQRPSAVILDAAVQCGDHLLARAQPMASGLGWRTPVAGEKPLAGFSHGAAGISWALLALTAVSGQPRFREAALGGLAYERSLYSAAAKNWPDLRQFDNAPQSDDTAEPAYMSAWCHGAPGVGLARLQMLAHLDDPALRAEIDAAVETTLAQGFGANHSLCHGDLGNLELLLQAGHRLDVPQWKTQTEQLAAQILTQINENGWICGVPQGLETPGLMTGLAGIGYGLLRLARPEQVPSVLVLEPPLKLP